MQIMMDINKIDSMVYKCFDKKTFGETDKYKNISNNELAEELHKPIIRKFKRREVHSPFIDNIWGVVYQICN